MSSSARRDVAPPAYADSQNDMEVPVNAKRQQPPQQGVYEPLLAGQGYQSHGESSCVVPGAAVPRSSRFHADTSHCHRHSTTAGAATYADDLDDFEYGVSVAASSIQIRHAFILKVYSTLFLQILGTVAVGWGIYTSPKATYYVQTHSYCFWVPLLCAVASMGALFVWRQRHPLNLFLLGAFTLSESVSIGTIVTFNDASTVLLALIICTFLVLGLTLFALQTKYDFTSWAGWLFTGLWAFILVGLAAMFFPFSNTIGIVYSGLGVLLFSGLLLVDTQVILRRLSPEDWVLGVVSLYLDSINIFINLLNLLSRSDD